MANRKLSDHHSIIDEIEEKICEIDRLIIQQLPSSKHSTAVSNNKADSASSKDAVTAIVLIEPEQDRLYSLKLKLIRVKQFIQRSSQTSLSTTQLNFPHQAITSDFFLIDHLQSYYRSRDRIPLSFDSQSSLHIDFSLQNTLFPREFNRRNVGDDIDFDIPGSISTNIIADIKNLINIAPILIIGEAGVGKSTTIQIIANSWSKQEIWRDKKYVFWLPLHFLSTTDWESSLPDPVKLASPLVKFIYYCCFKHLDPLRAEEGAKRIQLSLEDQKNTVLLLDGYDEVALVLAQNRGDLVTQEVIAEALEHKNIVMTSRPGYISKELESRFKILDTPGFTDSNFDDFVPKYYSVRGRTNVSERVVEFLQNNIKLVTSIANLPMSFIYLCTICEELIVKFGKDDQLLNLTDLYREIVLRYHNKSFEDSELDQISRILECIAFDCNNNDSIVIDDRVLDRVVRTAAETQKILASRIIAVNERGHHFIHQSFQDYFAALYIANLLRNVNEVESIKAITLLNKYKYSKRYGLILQFTAGILSSDTSLENQALIKFWDVLLNGTYDLTLANHAMVIVRTLNESNLDRRIPNLNQIIDYIARLSLVDLFSQSLQICYFRIVQNAIKIHLVQHHLVDHNFMAILGGDLPPKTQETSDQSIAKEHKLDLKNLNAEIILSIILKPALDDIYKIALIRKAVVERKITLNYIFTKIIEKNDLNLFKLLPKLLNIEAIALSLTPNSVIFHLDEPLIIELSGNRRNHNAQAQMVFDAFHDYAKTHGFPTDVFEAIAKSVRLFPMDSLSANALVPYVRLNNENIVNTAWSHAKIMISAVIGVICSVSVFTKSIADYVHFTIFPITLSSIYNFWSNLVDWQVCRDTLKAHSEGYIELVKDSGSSLKDQLNDSLKDLKETSSAYINNNLILGFGLLIAVLGCGSIFLFFKHGKKSDMSRTKSEDDPIVTEITARTQCLTNLSAQHTNKHSLKLRLTAISSEDGASRF